MVQTPFNISIPATPFTWKGRTVTTIKYLKADYGAVGDGTTDDRTAVQNFLNACNATSVMGWIEPGQYKISNYVTLSSNAFIRGAGATSIIRRHDGLAGGSWPTVWASGKSNILLERMNLQSDSTAAAATDEGLQLDNCDTVEVDRLWFDTLNYGIVTQTDTNTNIAIKNCVMTNLHNGFLLKDVNGMTVSDCSVDCVTTPTMTPAPHHFYVDYHVNNLLVERCTLKNGEDYSVHIYPGPTLTNVTFNEIVLENVRLGPCVTSDVIMGKGDTNHDITLSNFTCSSNRYYNGASDEGRQWFYIANGCYNVVVDGATITGDDLCYLARCGAIGSGCELKNITMTHCRDDKLPSGIVVDSGDSPTVTNVTVS